MKAAEIRRAFLDYFAERGHAVVSSSSLVPADDPTLFFTNAGMVQFKDVFTGVEKRPYQRATTVQKCMRVSGKHNDLENVGFTARHHTFFEMLGNFSFGNYFKEEAIAFAWDFLTRVMGLPQDRLLVTVFREDEESAALWRKVGVPEERIGWCGEKDNFWSMGPTGPCGPCTEIHWDLQSDFVPDDEPDPWGFGHDAGRYMEIWNNVFMQYERYEEDGQIKQRDLPRPSVDTGMGLERLVAIAQGHKSNWETDEFQEIIGRAARIAGTTYGQDPDKDVSLRVIADHARATAFLVADGVMPSNEGRGYVLRRIMRRAIRHGVKLGIEETFLAEVADRVQDLMSAAYPELDERRAFIEKVTLNEERTFRETLDRGLSLIDDAFARMDASGEAVLSGQTAFLLHDTYGFPPDLTAVIAGERGYTVDEDGYTQHMEAQRARSRAAHKGSGAEAVGAAYRGLEGELETAFTGHSRLSDAAEVLHLLRDGQEVDEAPAGSEVEIALASTPFYAESGGQVGDTGLLAADGLRVEVTDTRKPGGSVILHHGRVVEGTLRRGAVVEARVDSARRGDIQRNHTATHLLHAALRDVLGPHVQQKGSLVAPERLRFDFSHFEPLTAEQLAAIEDQVNEQILLDRHTVVTEASMDEATAMGAMALFGEKYGDRVRVVQVPGYSTELCGGTHCGGTGEIGLMKVVHEGGIAAGVRRIEALTGRGAFAYLRELERSRAEVAEAMRAPAEELADRVHKLVEDRKALRKEVEDLKQQLVAGGAGGGPQAKQIGGVPVLALALDGVSGKDLRGHADALMDKIGGGIVVLGARDGDRAGLLVKISKDVAGRVRAGDLVREIAPIVGGTGGGKPEMAQAGGREPEHLASALARAEELIAAALA